MCAKCAARPMWSLLVLEDVNTTRTKRANTNNIRTNAILSTTIELKRTRISTKRGQLCHQIVTCLTENTSTKKKVFSVVDLTSGRVRLFAGFASIHLGGITGRKSRPVSNIHQPTPPSPARKTRVFQILKYIWPICELYEANICNLNSQFVIFSIHACIRIGPGLILLCPRPSKFNCLDKSTLGLDGTG